MSFLRFPLAFCLTLFALPCAAQDADAAPPETAPLPTTALPPARLSPPMDGPTRVELEAVEVRIREIRRELPRLGGPIAVTVLGAVVATIPAALGLLYTAVTYPPSGASARNLLLGLGAGTLVGSGIAAGGLVWLGRRSRERRAYKPELDALKHRRKQLHELRWGPNVQSHHYGLALTARF